MTIKRFAKSLKLGKSPWEELPDGRRGYYYDVPGRVIGSARTPEKHKTFQVSETWKVSFVDTETLFFGQEIYDALGKLVEAHQKFPEDTGHKKV